MIILIEIICFATGTLAGIVLCALCAAASEESRRRETEPTDHQDASKGTAKGVEESKKRGDTE